jgi:hypothetical protein
MLRPYHDVRCEMALDLRELRMNELAVTAFFLPILDPAERR